LLHFRLLQQQSAQVTQLRRPKNGENLQYLRHYSLQKLINDFFEICEKIYAGMSASDQTKFTGVK
jgi:hypothetical protein